MLGHLPDVYLQVVMQRDAENQLVTAACSSATISRRTCRPRASAREQNITIFDKPMKKIVAVMQADEFRATWVANKAVYRTRMAMADGGELLIIAPGVERFGEQPEVDALIRKYGYKGNGANPGALQDRGRYAGHPARRRAPHPRLQRGPLHHYATRRGQRSARQRSSRSDTHYADVNGDAARYDPAADEGRLEHHARRRERSSTSPRRAQACGPPTPS